MNNRIGLIAACYEKFPVFFQYWLDSAKENSTVDFYLITDIPLMEYEVPDNVRVINWSFSELKERLQRLFPFRICLNTPYKLCDYKPVYGKLLEDCLVNNNWWGFVDVDVIFGDIVKFISPYINDDYIRIGRNGHFSIFRNTEETRMLYLKVFPNTEVYKPEEVYRHNHIFSYDEIGGGNFRYGIAYGMKLNGIRTADISVHTADILISQRDFLIMREGVGLQHVVFRWSNGVLTEMHIVNGNVVETEIMYVHFQKRRIKVNSSNREDYYMIPNSIIEKYDIESDTQHISSEAENLKWWIRIRMSIWKNRIKTGAIYWRIKDYCILQRNSSNHYCC